MVENMVAKMKFFKIIYLFSTSKREVVYLQLTSVAITRYAIRNLRVSKFSPKFTQKRRECSKSPRKSFLVIFSVLEQGSLFFLIKQVEKNDNLYTQSR